MAKYAKKTGRKTTTTKRKSTVGRTQKMSEKANVETLMAYTSNVTRPCLDDNYSAIADKSACIENIPISAKAHPDFQTNWDRFVKGKYEEYRIAKLEARIMFSNTEQPVLYLIDEESQGCAVPKQIVNDPRHGLKMVKENDNTLVITWKPRKGSSDYDYLPVKAFDDADFASPLAHLKILQHGLSAGVGTKGCTMQLKCTLACKGLQNAQGTPLTAAQVTAINNALN